MVFWWKKTCYNTFAVFPEEWNEILSVANGGGVSLSENKTQTKYY